MRKYELTYLVSDKVPESDLNKVTGKVAGFISDLGGKTNKEDIWGRRKLAYPIKKEEFATYVTLYFELPSEKTVEFERDMILAEGILRHLLIVSETKEEKLTLTTEDIAEAGEIKEVVGGEKSFEALEGETEESRDLMAVREDKEEKTPEKPAEEIKPVEIIEEKPEPEEKPKKEKASAKAKETKVSEEKVTEKTAKEETVEKPEETKESEEAKEEKKPAKKTKKETKDESDNEADRLSKLNEKLDDILGDEL